METRDTGAFVSEAYLVPGDARTLSIPSSQQRVEGLGDEAAVKVDKSSAYVVMIKGDFSFTLNASLGDTKSPTQEEVIAVFRELVNAAGIGD